MAVQIDALTQDQRAVFDTLLSFVRGSKQFFRLTGYAGTGKTYLIVKLLQWLNSEGKRYLVAAPTNKATKNVAQMAAAAGLALEPVTIARMLGQLPEISETGKEQFVSHNAACISDYEVVIIDEYSMISKENFEEIYLQAGRKTKVIFVGDNAQLPPINEELSLVCSAAIIKASATLSEVVRYNGELAKVAEQIRSEGKYDRVIYPFVSAEDGSITKFGDRTEWLSQAADRFASEVWQNNPNCCRALVFRNRTAETLNGYIRRRIYGARCQPFEIGDLLIARFPCFRTIGDGGDLRMIVQNSEELRVTGNYSVRTLRGFKPKLEYFLVPALTETWRNIDLKILTPPAQIIFEEKLKQLQEAKEYKRKWHLFKQFDHCPFAFSLTTHKAQGSSIDEVFIDVDDMATARDKQKLVYTAVTRARKSVFVY